MGFEKHAASLFLKLRSDGIKLGRVLTLGHQTVYLEPNEYSRFRERAGCTKTAAKPRFADDLFLALGADDVVAMDFSPYEGAHIVHDLNKPVPTQWHEQYDLVFDGGTLEHVFDFPTAIKSCMQMLKSGGRFISVTIPNNWCGHGFYQFSPELFYRIFSAANGFSVAEMYLSEVNGRTYAVKDPAVAKSRVELCNDTPVFLLLHARRDAVREIFAEAPQQSDYVVDWSEDLAADSDRSPWVNVPLVKHLQRVRKSLLLRRRFRSCSLANRKFYTPVNLTL